MAKHKVKLFKRARRCNFSVLETNKEFAKGKKRRYPPGENINPRFRSKQSGYGEQLQEKQKLRYMYGLTERQLKNNFKKVKKVKGVLGNNFLNRLESRLDNICYRMGIGKTRAAARQIVSHKHIKVNDRVINIPSFIVKPGDKITVCPSFATNNVLKANLANQVRTLAFVKFDAKTMAGEYVRLPKRDELNADIKESLIVEWYNRRI